MPIAASIIRLLDSATYDDFDRTYILNLQNASNSDGLYGFIDELSAYSQEAIFLHEISKAIDTINYLNNRSFNDNLLLTYTNNVLAYYKFNIYIARYLQYLRENDLAAYNFLVKKDTSLRQAYIKLNNRYSLLLQKTELAIRCKKVISAQNTFELIDRNLKNAKRTFALKEVQKELLIFQML